MTQRETEKVYRVYSIDPDRKTFQVLENDELKAVQFTHALIDHIYANNVGYKKCQRCSQIPVADWS